MNLQTEKLETMATIEEVKQWLGEWKAEGSGNFVYDFSGKIVNAKREYYIIDGKYTTVPRFKSEIPFRIREYFKSLIADIEQQALTDRVCLYDPKGYYDEHDEEYLDDEKKKRSRLPESVMDFWNATDVDYKFIYSLVSLVENKDIAKLVLLGFSPFKEVSLSRLVLTANYEGAAKEINSAYYWIGDMIIDKNDIWSVLRVNAPVGYAGIEWFELIKIIGNNLGYKYFNKYIIKEQKLNTETCKEKLVDMLADDITGRSWVKNTKDDIKECIRRDCLDYWNKYCPMNLYTMGYMYTEYGKLLALKDYYEENDPAYDELKEVKSKLADDLYEDILLKMLHKAKNKEQ